MTLTPICLALSLALPAQSGGFTDGHLVLLDPALNGPSSGSGGIAIVDPLSGATTQPYSLHLVPSRRDTLCYDRFRDRILFNAHPTSADPLLLLAGDAQGNYESLGVVDTPCQAFAPVGDGRVYFRLSADPVNALRLLDATDQISIVQDGAGEPYVPPINGAWNHMEYHPASNSLILVGGGFFAPCGAGPNVTVRRVDLSPDGTQALGDTCISFEVDPNGSSVPSGLSPLDAASMLLTVDTNSNADQPRLLRVQVDPLAVSVYSTTGYAGAAATNAGAYSRLRAQAVVYDTGGDALRAFSPGQGGEGFLVTPLGSLGTADGSGQTANLVEVAKPSVLQGLVSAQPESIAVVTGGTVLLQLELGPAAAGDLHLVLGSLSGVGPGVPLGAQTLPLAPDAYFALTLQTSGGSPVADGFGTLDANGRATASLTVGPLPPAFVGLVAQHAAVILDPVSFAVAGVTNPLALPLIP